jgi:DNA-binding transcriptional regulator GbsR (MarR family)
MKAARARTLAATTHRATLVDDAARLQQVKDDFIAQWGALGSTWGINRAMAQIHALLMVSPRPLSTDEVMADLRISRGNANTNLRDLVGWGLVRSVVRKGERKEFFESEKDVWKMFCTIVRERKRREITPALEALHDCAVKSDALKGPAAAEFHRVITGLAEFVRLADNVMDKVARAEQSAVVPWALRLLH